MGSMLSGKVILETFFLQQCGTDSPLIKPSKTILPFLSISGLQVSEKNLSTCVADMQMYLPCPVQGSRTFINIFSTYIWECFTNIVLVIQEIPLDICMYYSHVRDTEIEAERLRLSDFPQGHIESKSHSWD